MLFLSISGVLVNGHRYATAREAATALGLFVDNRIAVDTMIEAVAAKKPFALRLVFAMLLLHTHPHVDAPTLWERFKKVCFDLHLFFS